MALSGGGRLYADFDALRAGETYVPGGPRDAIRPKDVDQVASVLGDAGAVIVHTSVETTSGDRPVARVVAPVVVTQWT